MDTKMSLAIELATERFRADYDMALEGGCSKGIKKEGEDGFLDDYIDEALNFVDRCIALKDQENAK